ncbi:LPD38 domain-containing protein [Halomonas koreensis]|uniref:LPD5 domain-containing protein n=1 Tax=Halomonas koreensis TaxID=245385 RepID=A0ABU1G5D6_9GAMM|nr:LPD38 domain-containing protein [Halomonas koreensis]MDR5867916.1 LPD5 domain-containing protein [Halomonas koreensis]
MALIDDIRRRNPSLQNRSDEEIKSLIRPSPEFQYFSDEEFDAYVSGNDSGQPGAGQPDQGEPGFMAGLSAGIDQLQGMGGGLMMAAGEATESQGLLDAGREVYQRNMDEAAENDLGYGFTDIRGPGDAFRWARYTAGNLLPMMAASVAGGGAGGLAARGLAGAAAKQAAARIGQAAGAAGASVGMETGALMGETEDLDVSLAHGALAGSLDAITPVRLLRRAGAHELADKAANEISDSVLRDLRRQAGRSTLGSARSGSLTNLIGEASTEGLQGLIGQHANYWVENNGESLLGNLSEVDMKALVDEAAAGGLMGGLAGAPAGLGERRQARTQVSRIEAARQQAEAQGGDALDQAMAGQQAETVAQQEEAERPSVDPRAAAEVGNRVQLAMGDLDDLQSMARGSSYQGQTRLRNISRMIDRAEQALDAGNIAQAERMVNRAEQIGANLRDALRREGTDERPAHREGELVGEEEGRQGPAGLLGQDGRRLPAGDPETIFAAGPTADTTQYDPQARNVRRDEGLAAQRQGAERLREQQANARPQIADQGIVYGDGPTAGNANTGLDQPFADPRFAPDAETQAQGQPDSLRGQPIDSEWTAFAPESGTRGVPRAEMPQVKAENRGALANFLSARGIQSREETVPAGQLKPTQAEFSEARVQAAKDREGGDRAILISSDGHVVDGHHQWMAAADQGESVRAIRLDAPIGEVLAEVRDLPSAEADAGSARQQTQPQDDGLQRRTNGQPFASRRSALASGYARRAKRQGRRYDAVEVDGGFALQIEGDQAQAGRERDTMLGIMRDIGREMPGRDYSVAIQQGNAGQRMRSALGGSRNITEARRAIGVTNNDLRAAFEEGRQEAEQAQQPEAEPQPTQDKSSPAEPARQAEPATTQQQEQPSEAPTENADAPPSPDNEGGQDTPPEPNADAQASEPQPRRQADRIDDFGERIEGARKDQVNRVVAGLDTEVTADTTLGEAFPAPNYSKLIEEGVDPRAAAFVAVMRNGVPAKPRKAFKLKRWMQDLEQAQTLARDILSGDIDFERMLAKAQEGDGRYRAVEGALHTAELIAPFKPSLYAKAAKWKVEAGGGYSIFNGERISPNQTVYELRDDRGRHTGVWSTDFDTMRENAANAIANGVMKTEGKPKSRQTQIDVYRDTRTGDRFLAFKAGSRVIRLRAGFGSVAEAVDYLETNRDALQQQIDALRRGPQMRRDSNRPRGGEDRREGDVSPEQFSEVFGFRGVQFGNYVEGARRQQDLNSAYDALMDLASVLGVPPRAMSLDGTLGLAFGARGKGGRRAALAHYEPGQVVINLTKNGGPGSLAHEWFHALDNFIPDGQGSRRYQSDLVTDGPARAELADRWREMRQALKDSGFEARSRELDAPRSKPYFGTPIEMAARAFERHVRDRLDADGVRNDYLVNIDDEGGAYPTDAEMASIAPAFDRLIGTMEHRKTGRGVELYSLNPSSEALRPAPRAEDVATAIKAHPELADARVLQSAQELPPSALVGMALRDINPADVRGMYIGGDLYVIADNLESAQEGLEVAVHEAVGHKGMRAVLGEDLERVMLDLYRSLPNSKEGRAALAEVRRDYPFLDPSKREDRVTIGEEMVAHLLEKGIRPKAWQRAVAKIRELLRRVFPSIAWTYTDVLALGERSRDYLRRQQAERQGEDIQLYSLRGKQRSPVSEQFDDLSDAQRAFMAKFGPRTPPQKAVDWVREKWDRAGLKIRQGMVDRVAALKEMDERLYGESALGENIQRSSWVLARMSNAANGALHAMLHNGRIRLDPKEKVIQLQDDGSTGLGSVLGRLGSAAEIERFMMWIAANRSDKLKGEGREFLFSEDEIAAGKKLDQGRLEDGSDRAARYQEVFRDFQQYRDDVLAVAEQSGIISADQRAMWRDEFYVPFYRLSEEKGEPTGQMATSGLSRQQAYKRLKGGTQNINDLLQNTMMNFHHLLDASLKNQAAVQAVENAQRLGLAEQVPETGRDTSKSTFVMEGGKKAYYQIDDPLVFEALTSLAHPGMNSAMMKVMRGFKRVFTNLTTTTPQFMVANLIRDSLQATATNDVSKNAFKNVIGGARSWQDERTRAQMMASGAAFNFGHLYQNNPDELRAQLTRDMRNAQIVDGPYAIPDVLRRGWAWWNDVNNTAENVNRAAIYAQNREGGELRAAFESRDLIDFSAHGAWPAVRILIDIVPFLNARIQGLDKIYRSGFKPGVNVLGEVFGKGQANTTDKQAAARFWTVAGALTMATVALYLHNQDDEEYQKLEDWQKDTYWFFRAGDNAFFIPKPFEVGAIATMAERVTQQFVDDEATGKLFRQRMMHMMTDTFSFSPVPQMMQPALDVYANYDAFTGRPIESMGMDRLSPELRKRSSTSKAAEWISEGLNATVGAIGSSDTNPLALSPVQVDHLIGGYLGQVGTWVAGIGDVGWRAATGNDAPASRWHEFQPVRRFYRDLGEEDRYTRYGTVFYEGLREAGRAYADVKELREMGRLAEAAEVAESRRDMLALRTPLNRAQRRLNTVNKRIDMIRRSNLDGEIKRQRIDRLRAIKNQIQRALGERVLEARAG